MSELDAKAGCKSALPFGAGVLRLVIVVNGEVLIKLRARRGQHHNNKCRGPLRMVLGQFSCIMIRSKICKIII